jgi:excisionase family DNA binding protein
MFSSSCDCLFSFFGVWSNERKQRSCQPMSTIRPEVTGRSQGDGHPIVASVNETMAALGIGRAKIYELLNEGELESYHEGSSRKILWRSIEAYVERRLKQEAERRGRSA